MKPSGEKIAANRKKLEKLSRTAQRLGRSAEKYNGAKSRFSDAGKQLSKKVKELEKKLSELKKMKKGTKACGECRKEVCGISEKTGEELGKLARMMSSLEARRKLMARMDKLRQSLGRSQCYMLGKNGLKAGSAKDGNFNRREKTGAAGALTGVRLQKGKGPTAVQVEDAESGSGISRVTVSERKREFKYQVEGLVRREDVPEPLKTGVKKYFEDIHGSEFTSGEE